MASLEQLRDIDDRSDDHNNAWDFPTLTPENFSGSPKRRTNLSELNTVHLSLAETFKNYDEVLLFLSLDDRLEAILGQLTSHELLSERQRNQFPSPDLDKKNPDRFLRFLAVANASPLLAAVVILMGADSVGRSLLRMDNPRIRDLLKQSKGFDRPVNSPKSPYADLYEIRRAQLLRSPPPPLNFSPAPTQPMVLTSPPGTPTTFALGSPSEPGSPLYVKAEMHDIPEQTIHNVPDKASEEVDFPFSVVQDVEVNGSRVILTRTHTLYRDCSSRCFIAFNVVFQANQDRFKWAEISMRFLPAAETHQPPMILNIFPNPNQRWSTGPSYDLVSTAKKNINLTVGVSPEVPASAGANVGLEKSTEVNSASSSSLTAAGIATSKLTIALSESRAGDGIIYSFSFAVVLDLKDDQKPNFLADLRLRWQFGNRSWFPRPKYYISEKVFFSEETQLDGGG